MPYFSEDSVIASVAVLSGTTPLRITSTSLISNLNSDLLDGQHGDYYLNAANLTGDLSPAIFTDTTHGNRAGGTLHSAATTLVAGFLSPSDKIKLDSITPGANTNQNAYTYFTDGTHTSQASSFTSTFKFRSSDINYLICTVTENDPSHGDNLLLTLNTAKIEQDISNSISINYVNVAANLTATKNNYYFADTSLSSFIITPFSNPSPGDCFWILDFKNNFGINKLTLNTNTYEGSLTTYDLTIPNKEYKVMYINSTFGWKVL